jgi:vitamin B12 transporter
MFNLLPIAVLLLTCLAASAQTTLSGKVKDNKGRAIGGASLSLKDTYDGGTADSLGNYRFQTTEKGEHTLIATSIGYKVFEQKLTLAGGAQQLDITLREEPNELKAVVITAGTFEASDTKRATVLSPIDIVTTASANADVTGAIRTLPGAQQVGESEGLFVRGGTAQETKIFIDGTMVNNFFFSSIPDIAQRGRFSPFIFKGTVFSSGGYSALYGQALSSALILESVDLPDQSSANFGISTVGLSGGLQKLSKKKNASWGFNYSYTDLTAYFAVVKQRPDNFKVPALHNGEINFRVKTSKTGMLKFYAYFNQSSVGLRRPDIDSADLKNAFSIKNLNLYANLSWKEKLGKHWRLMLGTSWSTNTDKIEFELQNPDNTPADLDFHPYNSKTFNVKTLGDLSQIRAVLERRLYGLSAIRFGGEYMYFTDKNNFTNRYVTNAVNRHEDHYKAGFAEADIYITNDLAAKIGSRFEHSSRLEKSNIVPRVSLAYKLGLRGQASLAYGIFYQKPEKDYYLQNYAMSDLQYTKATHYIANYQTVSRDYTLRIEAFYKKYHDLVKTYATGSNGVADSVSNAGFGDAKGIELFWRDRKSIPNLDYWISYSYLDTKRDYLNYPHAMRPNFASTHTASVVLKKFVTKLKSMVNASYTFATPRSYYNIRYDNGQGKFQIADQGKTIPYHSLSFSINYLPNIGVQSAKKFTVWVFSVTNVLGNDQVFGYNYSANGMRKEPILPTARRFFFLGCFLSFGVDRTEDVINSNL